MFVIYYNDCGIAENVVLSLCFGVARKCYVIIHIYNFKLFHRPLLTLAMATMPNLFVCAVPYYWISSWFVHLVDGVEEIFCFMLT